MDEIGDDGPSSNKNILIIEVSEVKFGLRHGHGSFENLVKNMK